MTDIKNKLVTISNSNGGIIDNKTEDKNLNLLYECATKMKINGVIKQYLEVLL